jgi:hypothetical protein
VSEYPTKEELEGLELLCIKIGSIMKAPIDVSAIVSYLKTIWWMPEYVKYYEGTDRKWTLELVTGGWSGNEEIIGILEDTFFWFIFWQLSERGGRYVFSGDIP